MGFVALVGDILVMTGIHPPCVAFVVTKMDMFVEGVSLSAMVVDMLENAVVWMWEPVVELCLIGDSVVREKLSAFSVVFVWLADPFVAFKLEVGSSVAAVEWLNSLVVMLWIYFTVVAVKVVAFSDVVVANPLLLSGNIVDVAFVVIAEVVLAVEELYIIGVKLFVNAGDFGAVENAVVFADVCGSVFGSFVVGFLAVTFDSFADSFDIGCWPDVKTGAFVDVLGSDVGNAVDFSPTDFVSAVILTLCSLAVVVMEDVSLCVGLSVPETLTLWANGFSLALLVLSVEFRGSTA